MNNIYIEQSISTAIPKMDVVAATEVAPSLIQEWKEDIYKSESSSDVNSESVDGPYDYTPISPLLLRLP